MEDMHQIICKQMYSLLVTAGTTRQCSAPVHAGRAHACWQTARTVMVEVSHCVVQLFAGNCMVLHGNRNFRNGPYLSIVGVAHAP